VRKLSLFIAALFLAGCVSASVGTNGHDLLVFGKGTAKVTCEDGATGVEGGTCTTEATGDGLTENAVSIFVKFFETLVALPGAIVRGTGEVLP
jgi:hypothetical protein